MTSAPRTSIDPDNPPTRAEDWVGARKVLPGRKPPARPRRPVTFHVYRSSSDMALFAVTAERDEALLPPCPRRGRWEHLKSFRETGEARVAFSETDAKADIARRGYHLNRVATAARESASAK
jgi:hypothetical protein